MMDRLLTAGLCGNTIGQDIQTLTYHSSTSNMAFHLKDVCSSNFTWPLNMMLTLEKCALLKCLCGRAFAQDRLRCAHLPLKISVILGHTDKSSLIHLSNL